MKIYLVFIITVMTEAVAAIGLISNIIQLVDFGSKIINRFDKFQSNIN
jgi:hypothetical protein